MKNKEKLFRGIMFLLAVVMFSTITACNGTAPSKDKSSPNQYNPASDRINSMAGIPPESDTSSGGVVPNLVPIVDASRLAAANLEAGTVKTATRNYLVDHTVPYQLTSNDLEAYIGGTLKAKYYLDPNIVLIIRVDISSGGWIGMVFSLSQQKWLEGSADNNHPEDQDVP